MKLVIWKILAIKGDNIVIKRKDTTRSYEVFDVVAVVGGDEAAIAFVVAGGFPL